MDERNEGKHRCRACEHRRDLPGSAHSACHHPVIQRDRSMELLATLGLPDINAAVKLGVTCREYGLRSGWFAWPYNFDPVWLLTCFGFEEARSKKCAGG